MKKTLIISIVLFSLISLSSAINLTLSSGQKLDNNSWNNLSGVLNKIDVSGNNLNINGKFSVDGKICDSNNDCLGECISPANWDTVSNTCIIPASTPETAALSCKDLYDNQNVRTDGNYYIKPTGFTGNAFEVYCDMTTNGGGRTKWYDSNNLVGDVQAIVDCKNNGYNFTDGFYCVSPEILSDVEYRLDNGGNIFYPSVKTTYKNQPYVKGWQFREKESPLTVYTCREYDYDGGNGARFGTSGTFGKFQQNINCFVR